MFNNNLLMGASAATGSSTVSINNSALFINANNESLSRGSMSGTATTWTASCWVYRTEPALGATAANFVFTIATDSGLSFGDGTTADVVSWYSGSYTSTSAVFRDTGWYHLVVKSVAGSGTVFVNGNIVLSGLTVNGADATMSVGAYNAASNWFDGYISEFVFIDGTALNPTSFAEYDSTGLFWTPKSSSTIKALTFGTNGFYLDNTTNAQTDASGEGNDFTNNNTVTLSNHTPTNMQALWNQNFKNSTAGSPTLTNGNKTIQVSSTSEVRTGQNLLIPTVGKWIMGVSQTAADDTGKAFGIWTTLAQTTGFPSVTGLGGWHVTTSTNAYQCDGTHIINITTSVGTPQAADQFWICADVDNSKIFFGFWDNSASSITWYAADGGTDGNPVTGDNPSQSIDVGGATFGGTGYNNKTFTLVAEADIPFTVPSGYKFLNTTNIAAATSRTAADTNKYFQSIVYEGNGTGQRVGAFQPFDDTFTVANGAVFNGTNMSLSRNQTTGTSAGTVWTFSAWIKRCEDKNTVFVNWSDESAQGQLGFNASGQFYLYSGATVRGITTPVWTNTSEWFHYHVAYDTGESGTDKVKLTINGNLVTAWATDNRSTASAFEGVGVNGEPIIIGNNASGGSDAISLNGYMAQVVFLDGTASAASNFGKTDTTTNRWVPKDLSSFSFGSGNNTFFLDFADSGNLGDDESGNTNDYTNNNTVTQVADSPTINVATLDPNSNVTSGGTTALSNGNRTSTQSSGGTTYVGGTLVPDSGKFVWEVTVTNVVDQFYIGIKDTLGANPASGSLADDAIMYQNDGTIDVDGTTYSSSPATYTDGDVIRVEWDVNVKIEWFKNNSSQGSYTLSKSSIIYKPFFVYNDDTASFTVNFGASSFAHTPTTDYSALTQDNLTSSDQYISALSWIKNRDATDNNMLFDRVRGVYKNIHSNTDDVQVTNTNTLKSFLAGGAQIGEDVEVNTANESYVLWNWMIETTGSGTSNEDGTINTAATLVDTTLGLSISQYEGTGSNATVGHGLGVAPEVIIVKEIVGGASNWQVYNASLGNTKVLYLNLVNGAATDSAFQDTTPTSSVFSIGTGGDINGSGNTYIAYCFAPSQFIAMGSYEGNGNADGTYVPILNSAGVPIQPVWAIFKNADNGTSGSAWSQEDTSRSPTNVMDKVLSPNENYAEGNWGDMDFVTGGIKQRGTNLVVNESGSTIIYMAIGTPIIDTDGRIIAGR